VRFSIEQRQIIIMKTVARRRTHMDLPEFLARDRHGYIHFAGHRIGLRHVVELYKDGYTPEMLHDHFPTLPLALIHKGIAFYLENQPEFDAYAQQSREALDRLAAAPQPGPDAAELQRRMAARRPKESA
jgi:uncharacterized protein (DUF433 family)